MKQALSGKLTFLDNRSNNKSGFFYKVLYLQGCDRVPLQPVWPDNGGFFDS